MTSELCHKSGFGRAIRRVFAALLLLGLATDGQAQGNSPVGQWDCVISGSANGLASLTFFSSTNGGTFTGVGILVPKAIPSPRVSLIPSMVSGLGRNDLEPSQPSNQGGTNFSLFGSTPLEGPWAFDSKGRVNGSFAEVIAFSSPQTIECTTNQNITTVEQTTTVTLTNLDGSVTTFTTNIIVFNTNTVITCVTNASPGLTNTASFSGKAVPGKRLTFVARTPQGQFTFRGVPSSPLTALTGPWSGAKKQNGFPAFELFELTAQTNALDILTNGPNTYLVDGAGPNYTYSNGIAILSAQKKIAFAFNVTNGTTYQSTRAVIGPFNSTKLKANTTGIDSPGGQGALTNRVTFKVEKRTSVP